MRSSGYEFAAHSLLTRVLTIPHDFLIIEMPISINLMETLEAHQRSERSGRPSAQCLLSLLLSLFVDRKRQNQTFSSSI